jgi:hypothetical protein
LGPDKDVNPFGFTLDYVRKSDTFDSTGAGRYPGNDLFGTPTPYWYGATGDNLLSYTYLPTAVAGFYDGNDSGGLKPGLPNTGIDGKGLLNGEGGIVDGELFYTTSYDTLQNLYGDDDAVDDPGWINLGKGETDGTYEYEDLTILTDTGDELIIDIRGLLTLVFDFNNNVWELATDPTKMPFIVPALGGAAFDHLAFVMKAGNENGQNPDAGFAIFDFNFNTIFREYEKTKFDAGIIDFNTAYTLGGRFDDSLFDPNVSHVSVWAKDPTVVVPEPTTIVLFGIGLLSIARIGRRRSA